MLDNVQIVSIHDGTPEYFSFDVWDIVECLFPAIEDYQWVAFDLDVTGEPMEEGKPITSREFQSRSKALIQTIEGKFLAYPGPCPDLKKIRMDYSHFPKSQARVAIIAVDSSYFEVYTKDLEVIHRLKEKFNDVREEDTGKYFLVNDQDETPLA